MKQTGDFRNFGEQTFHDITQQISTKIQASKHKQIRNRKNRNEITRSLTCLVLGAWHLVLVCILELGHWSLFLNHGTLNTYSNVCPSASRPDGSSMVITMRMRAGLLSFVVSGPQAQV